MLRYDIKYVITKKNIKIVFKRPWGSAGHY